MVQVSRHPLSEELFSKLLFLFFKTVGKKSRQNEFERIIRDLFSPTEQIMVLKRIAILYLLLKGISSSQISNTLKVSSSTVAKFSLLLRNQDGIILQLRSMIKNEKFEEFLEDIFYDVFYKPGVKGVDWNNALRMKRLSKLRRERGI